MNNKSFLTQCICVIIFLSIFSSCNSSSNQVKEMEKKIVLADSIINDINGVESVLAPSIDELFTYETTFEKMRFLNQCGAKLDSITYIGHNWFKVSYDLTDITYWYYGISVGDLALLYLKINKEDDKFKLDDVAYAYSQCTSYIEDFPVADRIKFWFKSFKYDDVQSYFQGNICKVRDDDKYGFINIEGIEILPCKYDSVAFVMGDLIKKDEKEIVYDACWDSLLYVKLDNKYGLINLDGKEITPCKYDNLTLFTKYEYLFKTELDDKFGLINFDGKEIIPCKYSDLIEFGDAIKVKSNDKYGLVTYACGVKEIIPCKYDDFILVEYDDEFIIKSKSNDKYGLIVEEEEILPCMFDKLETNEWGMVKVQRDNLWRYYTTYGTIVTEYYEDIEYYYDENNPTFAAKLNGKWGYINETGDLLIPFVLDAAGKPYKDGTAFVEYNGQWGELDLNTQRFSRRYDNSASNSGNSIIRKTCTICSGTGQMPVRGGGIVLGYQQCPACGGLGYSAVPSNWSW